MFAKMKTRGMVILLAFLILLPGFAQSQPARSEPPATIGPFLVEDLEMVPDPVKPGQEVRFKARLRNNGIPVRANIRIQDRDEIVALIDHARIEPGVNEYRFPDTGYALQRNYHCFTVVIEVEGKPYPVETPRELCAKPLGWTMRP
jgi:hypothetical protein